MSKSVTKEEVIGDAFEALTDSGLLYCGVGLPSKLLSPESRDVDLFVSQNDLESLAAVLAEAHQRHGWTKIKEIKNEYSLQLFYCSDSHLDDSGGFVQWDLMPWSSWRGVPFVDASELTPESVTENGLSYLHPSFQKDYKKIRSLLCKPSDTAKSERSMDSFSEWVCQKLHVDASSIEKLGDREIRRKFVFRSFLRRPVRTVTGVLSFLYYYLLRMLSPPGLVLGAPSDVSEGFFDQEIESLMLELPVTGIRIVPFLQWKNFSGRLKLLAKMFVGDVIVISGYAGEELSKRQKKWGMSYLLSGKVDRVIPVESIDPASPYQFRKIIQKVLQDRISKQSK